MEVGACGIAYLMYAPERRPQAWGLDPVTFARALADRFPEARCRPVEGCADRVSFWVMTEGGVEFDGFADRSSRHTIALSAATVDEAAAFMLWLRDAYLPEPGLIRFTSELAYARGVDTDWCVPAEGGHGAVVAEIRRHLLASRPL